MPTETEIRATKYAYSKSIGHAKRATEGWEKDGRSLYQHEQDLAKSAKDDVKDTHGNGSGERISRHGARGAGQVHPRQVPGIPLSYRTGCTRGGTGLPLALHRSPS